MYDFIMTYVIDVVCLICYFSKSPRKDSKFQRTTERINKI